MAFTQQQIVDLQEAIASGTLRVKYADREVTYQNLAEMRALLTQMRREVAVPGPKKRRGLIRLYQSGSGL